MLKYFSPLSLLLEPLREGTKFFCKNGDFGSFLVPPLTKYITSPSLFLGVHREGTKFFCKNADFGSLLVPPTLKRSGSALELVRKNPMSKVNKSRESTELRKF